MSPQPIHVVIDDRARLMSAVLAGSTWPEMEQSRHRYRTHVHARNTTRLIREHAGHPAVQSLQRLLDKGAPLNALYHYALTLTWPDLTPQMPHAWAPPGWPGELVDFRRVTGIAEWWDQESEVWQIAEEQTAKVLRDIDLGTFFAPFFGQISDEMHVIPNISYPGDTEVGVRLHGKLICIVAPRVAWGESDPWPFDEDPAHIFRSLIAEYGRMIMGNHLRANAVQIAPLVHTALPVDDSFRAAHTTWSDQLIGLFTAGAVALFLEQSLGFREADAYILMENRLHGLTILPAVVSVLKEYLAGYDTGTYRELADYLPYFTEHLRAAIRTSSL